MSTLDRLLLSLAGAPSLPGARCRGRRDGLFDGTDGLDGEQTRQAAQLCRRCPSLHPCEVWAHAQPDKDLDGVIAGRLFVYVAHESQRKFPNGSEIL